MIRTWWAALALLAVFAMHGLATHASATEPIPVAAPSAAAAGAPATSGHAGHAGHSGHIGHAAADDTAPTSAVPPEQGAFGHDGGHHSLQVLGLCLAVLASAAIALLRLLRPRPGVIAVRGRALRIASVSAAPRQVHAPPDLHALSVQRC